MASTTASTSSAKPFQSMPRSGRRRRVAVASQVGGEGGEAGRGVGPAAPRPGRGSRWRGRAGSAVGPARPAVRSGVEAAAGRRRWTPSVDVTGEKVAGRLRDAPSSTPGEGDRTGRSLTSSRRVPTCQSVERPGDEQVAQHGDGRRVDDERALHEQLAEQVDGHDDRRRLGVVVRPTVTTAASTNGTQLRWRASAPRVRWARSWAWSAAAARSSSPGTSTKAPVGPTTRRAVVAVHRRPSRTAVRRGRRPGSGGVSAG